jgi:SPP1 gp7 family putative phage head morphogenesis protein
LNTEYYKAKRIVVTESAFFSSRAQQDCFDDLGVEKYEIVATLDMKTSEICKFMDGKVFEQKRFKPGVTAAPFHCNCRTFQSPSFDDEFEINTKRAARNKDGKTVYIDSNIKYQEWLDKFTKED